MKFFRDGFFGRNPQAPQADTPKPKDLEMTNESLALRNHDMMIRAISEHMLDLGMTHGKADSPSARSALAIKMAQEALALAPTNYETLPTAELNANKSFLVAEAIRLYQEDQSLKNKKTDSDQKDTEQAA